MGQQSWKPEPLGADFENEAQYGSTYRNLGMGMTEEMSVTD